MLLFFERPESGSLRNRIGILEILLTGAVSAPDIIFPVLEGIMMAPWLGLWPQPVNQFSVLNFWIQNESGST
jgi:hypothetical protein